MTRSRKHKHNPHHSEQASQSVDDNQSDASTSESISYGPPPGPPTESSSADIAEVVRLHPQGTLASFLRLASGLSPPGVLTSHGEEADEHFVDVPDCSNCADLSPASSLDLPVSHDAKLQSDTPPQSNAAEPSQRALPRIAVHASAVSDLHTSTPQQSFTISAGPRSQKLYYLWSPKHRQQDAAMAPGPSYMEALDDGKKKLLKQGSSPFADVTKQQVARMATWEPDPQDESHSRQHMRPWWVRLFSPWQRPGKGDAEALDEGDSPKDKGAVLAVPGWRWKVVLFLCCLVAMICYVDRAAMSVAIIPMSLEYGWSNSVKGAINRYVHLLLTLFMHSNPGSRDIIT